MSFLYDYEQGTKQSSAVVYEHEYEQITDDYPLKRRFGSHPNAPTWKKSTLLRDSDLLICPSLEGTRDVDSVNRRP